MYTWLYLGMELHYGCEDGVYRDVACGKPAFVGFVFGYLYEVVEHLCHVAGLVDDDVVEFLLLAVLELDIWVCEQLYET